MELAYPKTPKERWEVANGEMSKHCFEAGRLRFVIEMDEESLEKKRLQAKNMRVDFDKLNKKLQDATKEYLASEKKEAPEQVTQ